jgi:hypothetical protein
MVRALNQAVNGVPLYQRRTSAPGWRRVAPRSLCQRTRDVHHAGGRHDDDDGKIEVFFVDPSTGARARWHVRSCAGGPVQPHITIVTTVGHSQLRWAT